MESATMYRVIGQFDGQVYLDTPVLSWAIEWAHNARVGHEIGQPIEVQYATGDEVAPTNQLHYERIPVVNDDPAITKMMPYSDWRRKQDRKVGIGDERERTAALLRYHRAQYDTDEEIDTAVRDAFDALRIDVLNGREAP